MTSRVALLAVLVQTLAACHGGGEPPSAPPGEEAPPSPAAPTAAPSPPGGEETPRDPEPSHACAPGVTLEAGHAHATLPCLPHLDAIDYWSSASAWAAYDAAPVTVAILDGAFDVAHPDLAGAVSETWDFARPACATFVPEASPCADVAPTPPASPSASQLSGLVHGTVIAGVVAGRGAPGAGVVGVAPTAKLVLVGRDASADNLKALRFAVDQRVDVISMSWPLGAPPGDKHVVAFEALLEEATQAGIVVVMAAGNRKIDVDAEAIYPTRYSAIPGVIAVGAVSAAGDFDAAYSNFGPGYVDLGAPGTVASSGGDLSSTRYSVQTGTSFSGPLVAGAVARVIQYLRTTGEAATPAEIEALVVAGARKDQALAPYFREGSVLDMTALLAHLRRADR